MYSDDDYDNLVHYDYNDLEDKEKIPSKCKKFVCVYNNVDKLPKLPKYLVILHCESNNLTTLPELPDLL